MIICLDRLPKKTLKLVCVHIHIYIEREIYIYIYRERERERERENIYRERIERDTEPFI